jgi:MFS family permease
MARAVEPNMNSRHRRFPFVPGAEDFRYHAIAPDELPRVMRRHILTGTMGTIYGMLTTGMFLVAFGNAIGVSIEQWGILTAICSFAIAFQLVSAYGAARVGYRRLIWYLLETASRLLRATGLGLAFLLFKWGDNGVAALCLIALLSAGSFFAAAATPPWYSWLADIIPERVHGSFMGRRDAWISLGAIGIALPLSYCLDRVLPEFKVDVLAVIFGVGFLLGMVDMFMHRVIPEPPPARKLDGTLSDLVLAPLLDRQYRSWLVFTTFWNFAMFLGGALATIYFVNDLRIRDNFLGGSIVLIAVPLLGTMLTSKWSGALVDRLGVRRVLMVSYFFWGILPVFWIIATPATALFWLTINAAIGGAASSAAVNASNKLILRVPPRSHRAMYMAVTACLNNAAGGVAALIAGYFLAGMGDRHWFLWGKDFVPFDLLFAISFVLRLASWLLIFRLPTPGFDTGKR